MRVGRGRVRRVATQSLTTREALGLLLVFPWLSPACATGGCRRPASWRGDQPDGVGRRDDADVLEAAEREQVVVAGDEEIGLGGDGGRDNLIVVSIGAITDGVASGVTSSPASI
jgi:hypothetical protein